MYYAPFYIKRYKTTAPRSCIVNSIRSNTLYKYDSNGYIKRSNPNNLICRNEVDTTIYLRDQLYYRRMIGGVTAVRLKKEKNSDKTIITTIAYHDTGGILWFLLFTVAGIGFLINQTESIWALITPIVLFSLLFGLFHTAQLKRQRKLVESVVEKCEIE